MADSRRELNGKKIRLLQDENCFRYTHPTCERLLKYLPVLILLLVISACTPYGHWGRYDYWRDNCPGFPTYEEVEQVLKENEKLLNEMLERKLIYKTADITPCPTVHSRSNTCYSGRCDGAFVTLYSKNKAGTIKMLDEANARAEGLTMLYGVPFRFIRD